MTRPLIQIDGVVREMTQAEHDEFLSQLAGAAVPQTLTIRQAKLVLLQNDLLDDVDAAVAQADRATQIEWEYAQEVSRTWPTLVTMAAALGMTDQQLDDLFIAGAKL